MEAKDFISHGIEALQRGDWDGAYAAFSAAIERGKDASKKTRGASLSDNDCAQAYLGRAKAGCFRETKEHREGNFHDVIDDASSAEVRLSGPQANDAFAVRAYGYYLNGEYERAIADCKAAIHNTQGADMIFALELLASIYSDMGRYSEAAENYQRVLLYRQHEDWSSASPLLLNRYREASKKTRGT